MNIRPAPPPAPPLETRDILGVEVAFETQREAIARLQRAIAADDFTPIGFLNAHVANIACADPEFRRTLDGFLILADGVGVDMAAKLLHGESFPANLNGTDFAPAFLRATRSGLRVGLLGARRENVEAAARRLAHIAPGHDYIVFGDGFFSPDEEAQILARLKELRPDVLLVAMGVPRQEQWIAQNLTPDHCIVAMGVGALFDFLSGAVPRAPHWMRRLRLEWVFRLSLEPARMWRRYVVGNPLFLARVVIGKLSGQGQGA